MKSVVIVGAGNIGSHLIPLIARLPEVGRILVIDRDRYEQGNCVGQSIAAGDVGRAKAAVQEALLRKIAPSTQATGLVADIAHVPLGRLRVDLILACLDSRLGRQTVNQAAFRLGVPWIDSGVQADGWFARVNVYLPGADRPCLECAWDEGDYRNIEQAYPCEAGEASGGASRSRTRPTNAPAALGALAASLQAIEAGRILGGRIEPAVAGRQILIDADHQTHFVTSFRFHPGCRLGDHAPWKLIDVPAPPSRLRFRDLCGRLPGRPEPEACTFSIEGRPFGLAVRCSVCGRRRATLRLERVPPAGEGPCRSCGGRVVIPGFDRRDRISGSELTAGRLDRPLAAIGARPGDVVRVEAGNAIARFVIAGDSM